MADIPYFTVFTPSFNSRETLPRVYESLRAQTYDKFEWLVVNDGSTDGTEALVEKWQGRAAFPIRYFSQENRGKHRSFNRAVTEAKGALFICLDADDECVPDALEKCRGFWESIPKQDRNDFSGVTVHCTDASGKIVGKAFPKHCMDLTPGEMNVRHPIRGRSGGYTGPISWADSLFLRSKVKNSFRKVWSGTGSAGSTRCGMWMRRCGCITIPRAGLRLRGGD